MVDPLSDVLSLLEVQGLRCTRLEAAGAWSLRFGSKPLIKFVAVLRGTCWITLEGEPPQRVEESDTFLLIAAPAYVVASDPVLRPVNGDRLYAERATDVARLEGDDVVLMGGGYVVEGDDLSPLLGALPPFLRIPAGAREAEALRGTLELLNNELGQDAIGGSLMAKRLAEILLVQALRACASDQEGRQTINTLGWVGALADPQVGAAIRLMHRDVGRRWTVGDLAAAVGMSRSAFALRFRERVGQPPLDYLLRWRMQQARAALRRGDVSVATLAARLGYASDAAFGFAFKRVYGRAPKSYWPAGRARSAG